MRKITIDGSLILTRADLHSLLKTKFKNRGYYGSNLDAVWDVLSIYDKDILIEVINTMELFSHLNEYGLSFIETLLQVSFENNFVKVNVISAWLEGFVLVWCSFSKILA